MILHALKILENELNAHLNIIEVTDEDKVILGNVGTLETANGVRTQEWLDKILITLVNFREEKTLKNGPYSRVNDATLRTEYFNPAVYANFYLLFTATASNYDNALTYLSRIIRFFQSKNVFTPDNLEAPTPVTISNEYDVLQDFKIILDLYSPTFEELNHLWGTLGGRQYPSVLYQMRLLELKHDVRTVGGGVITEIERKYKTLAIK